MSTHEEICARLRSERVNRLDARRAAATIERLATELAAANKREGEMREVLEHYSEELTSVHRDRRSLLAQRDKQRERAEAAEKREAELDAALLWIAGNADMDFGDRFVEVWNSETSDRVAHDGTAAGFRAAILEAVALLAAKGGK